MQSSCYLHDLPIQIAQCPYDDLAEVARSRYSDCAIVVYVHGFKRPSMFIFDALLNRASKSCDVKSCYEEASVFVEHGPNVWH